MCRDMQYLGNDQLLLVHGSADDNVHLRHTMVLTRQLIRHSVVFRQMVRNIIDLKGQSHEILDASLCIQYSS
jgi:hypothetical protein